MDKPVEDRGRRMLCCGPYDQNTIEIAIGAPAPFAAKDALPVVPEKFETGISMREDRRRHLHLPDSGGSRPLG
ncbi:hypothetical protein [Bradyrhizobium sp. JR3.5]